METERPMLTQRARKLISKAVSAGIEPILYYLNLSNAL